MRKLEKEIVELQDRVEKLQTILRHVFPEKTNALFITGHCGERDENGLPQKLIICPAYGSDVMVLYAREDNI